MENGERQVCSYTFDAFMTLNFSSGLRIPENGDMQEQIDEDDEDLQELKTKWGEEIYKAVTKAFLEIIKVNPSGSYAVSEIWNLMEDERASMTEIIPYISVKENVANVGTKWWLSHHHLAKGVPLYNCS
jgi:hypothetical protein